MIILFKFHEEWRGVNILETHLNAGVVIARCTWTQGKGAKGHNPSKKWLGAF